jgi:hypothetical protein
VSGVKISNLVTISHILFVDDILVFLVGSCSNISHIKRILSRFALVTGMKINERKSTITSCNLFVLVETFLDQSFSF